MNMSKKYHYVYKTTNLINNKIYIGVHSTNNLNDGYIGCGISIPSHACVSRGKSPFKTAVRKYGYDNFKREIIVLYDKKEDAYKAEELLVTKDFINRPDTYNAQVGGIINRATAGNLPRNKHSSSKKVRNVSTGEIFDCIMTVSEIIGMNHSTLSNKLKGRCYNNVGYELVDSSKVNTRIKTPNNIKYTNIKGIDNNGNVVKEYDYINKIEGGGSNVLSVLSGKRSKALGLYWVAYNPYTKEYLGLDNVFSNIRYVSIDSEGNKLMWDKLSELLTFIGYSTNSSHRVLNRINLGKPSKGYQILTIEAYNEKFGILKYDYK